MRKKNKTFILEASNRIEASFGIVTSHVIQLEKNGEWKLGNLYFDAVAMQLEVISEYVCKLLDNTGEFGQQLPYAYPEIPWSQIHRFRQLLAHWYVDRVSADDVREILRESLPLLMKAIQNIRRNELA